MSELCPGPSGGKGIMGPAAIELCPGPSGGKGIMGPATIELCPGPSGGKGIMGPAAKADSVAKARIETRTHFFSKFFILGLQICGIKFCTARVTDTMQSRYHKNISR